MARKPYKVGIPENEKEIKTEDITVKPQVSFLKPNATEPMPLPKPTGEVLFKVKVNHPSLRRRRGPSENADIIGLITDQGIYDVYLEQEGWGWLSDGTWIMLRFCSIV